MDHFENKRVISGNTETLYEDDGTTPKTQSTITDKDGDAIVMGDNVPAGMTPV